MNYACRIVCNLLHSERGEQAIHWTVLPCPAAEFWLVCVLADSVWQRQEFYGGDVTVEFNWAKMDGPGRAFAELTLIRLTRVWLYAIFAI